MTIDEAIYILELDLDVDYLEYHRDSKNAVRLGIEALKLITQEPPCGYTCIPRPLPGETKS